MCGYARRTKNNTAIFQQWICPHSRLGERSMIIYKSHHMKRSRFKVLAHVDACLAFIWWRGSACKEAAVFWELGFVCGYGAGAQGRGHRPSGRVWWALPRRWKVLDARCSWREAAARGSAWWHHRRWAGRPPQSRSLAASAASSPRPASISREWDRQSVITQNYRFSMDICVNWRQGLSY